MPVDRDFAQGRLTVDFATEPFDSAPRALVRASRLYVSNLPFLAAITVLVYLPVKLAVQLACHLLDVPTDGILSYSLLEIGDLVLSALVIPAAIYGLMEKLRTGKTAGLRDSLRWGRRQWVRVLWNKFKVEITIALWGLLLIVPGIMAMARLALTDAIVSIEADRESDPLQRSTVLSKGRRWRILLVVAVFAVVDLVGGALVLGASSRVGFALADCALAVLEQWFTAAVLVMYLGTVKGTPDCGAALPGRRRFST